jgi:S-disulfanyl-L-cysteine oxidoreductase SoxD
MRRAMAACALLALAALAACNAPDRGPAAGLGAGATGGSRSTFAEYDAGTVSGGPGSGRSYGLGTAATSAHLARLDHDIGADGAELPTGRGSVSDGEALYKAQCAMCHGQRGEGMLPAYPALIGRDPAGEGFKFATDPRIVPTIGNYWPYATTIFDYIRRAMPLTAPGSLTDDQVYALTAYLLAGNDVIPDTTTLDADGLRAVRMPYVDRFIPDARQVPAPVK